MIYLYAITEPSTVPPDCNGLDDAPLELLERDGVAGAYSSHSQLECRPEPELLWRHELVVERLMDRGAILPARFGTTFTNEDALGGALSGAAARLRPQLDRVRGRVELAVRVRSPLDLAATPRDGRGYLNAKLSHRREGESIAQRTLVPLEKLACDSRRHRLAPDSGVITASYLVARERVSQFADEVRLLQQDNEELTLSCTGPWAPYSFTEEEEA